MLCATDTVNIIVFDKIAVPPSRVAKQAADGGIKCGTNAALASQSKSVLVATNQTITQG